MSDDAITSISQFSTNAKANQKLDHSAGASSQDNDFKQFISQEESRLQRDNGKLAKNTDIETDTSGGIGRRHRCYVGKCGQPLVK